MRALPARPAATPRAARAQTRPARQSHDARASPHLTAALPARSALPAAPCHQECEPVRCRALGVYARNGAYGARGSSWGRGRGGEGEGHKPARSPLFAHYSVPPSPACPACPPRAQRALPTRPAREHCAAARPLHALGTPARPTPARAMAAAQPALRRARARSCAASAQPLPTAPSLAGIYFWRRTRTNTPPCSLRTRPPIFPWQPATLSQPRQHKCSPS